MEFGTTKLEKIGNLGPKTLRKPGIWYLEKSWNPAKQLHILLITHIYKYIYLQPLFSCTQDYTARIPRKD